MINLTWASLWRVFCLLINNCWFTFGQDVLFPFLFQHHAGWKPVSEQHINLVLASLLQPCILIVSVTNAFGSSFAK